jgi:hypothetical protein
MTSPPRISVPAALALVLGGANGLAVMAYGLFVVASTTSPESYGLDFSSDGRPGPEAVQFGLVITLIGVAMVTVAVQTASRGRRWQASALSFVLVIVLVAGWSHASRDTRNCAYNTYRDRPNERCIPELAAELRDFAILATPSLVGLACLLISRRTAEDPQAPSTHP